jgi:hypothetical protein
MSATQHRDDLPVWFVVVFAVVLVWLTVGSAVFVYLFFVSLFASSYGELVGFLAPRFAALVAAPVLGLPGLAWWSSRGL